MTKKAMPAMEYSPMFFIQIIDAFFVRTDPASSIVNPAHIHITSTPHTRKEKVLSTYCVSPSTPAARAGGEERPGVEPRDRQHGGDEQEDAQAARQQAGDGCHIGAPRLRFAPILTTSCLATLRPRASILAPIKAGG